jgi:tRNA threonylcarbamoyladenosine biosynthesis protein TsaB
LILHLDTSTRICSVALATKGVLIGTRESHDEKSHARQLIPFIHDLLMEHDVKISGLDAVAVSKGPGSYTGLRIGVSTAKGLAYGSNIPLIGIDTLDSLVSGALRNPEVVSILGKSKPAFLCPMIDARRMEVYTAFYSHSGERLEKNIARIINKDSYRDKLRDSSVVFFGNGADKCKEKITHPNAIFIEGIETTAENMIPLAEESLQQNRFEDVAYFEPFYLKDFIATIPKNKIVESNYPPNKTK